MRSKVAHCSYSLSRRKKVYFTWCFSLKYFNTNFSFPPRLTHSEIQQNYLKKSNSTVKVSLLALPIPRPHQEQELSIQVNWESMKAWKSCGQLLCSYTTTCCCLLGWWSPQNLKFLVVNEVQGLFCTLFIYFLHIIYEECCQCTGCVEMSTATCSNGQRLLFRKAENLPSDK